MVNLFCHIFHMKKISIALFLFSAIQLHTQIVQVADIRPGTSGSDPESLIFINGKLFFRADNGAQGKEWFTTDGTEAGTVLLKDIYPGMNGSALPATTYSNYCSYNDLLLFEAVDTANNNELWRSDGTTAGTFKVKEIYPGNLIGGMHASLQNAGGTVYFAADDGAHGIEIWTSDGTDAGTYLVCDIDSTAPSMNSTPEKFYAYNDLIYFKATKDLLGDEIWVTNGTAAGTYMLKNMNNGDGDGCHPDYFTDYLGIIYFTAYTDLDGPIDTELWKSDGTAAGTQLVKDIAPGIAEGLPRYLTVVNNKLCFSAKSSGTNYELWVSDGSEAGTVLLKDIFPGLTGSNPQNFTRVDSVIYFTADDGVNGKELWKTDGTEAGTMLVKNIRAGSSSSSPGNLTAVNDLLYFTANNGMNGNELWQSDGTEAGTIMVQDLNPSGSSLPSNLFFTGTDLFFSASVSATGKELYRLSICPLNFATITPAGATEFCKGGSVTLNAATDPGYTYQWIKNGANITGAASSSYIATKTGNYQVQIISGTCADISETIDVTVYNKPNPVISNPDATNDLCFDTSIKLKTGTAPGNIYQWYNGAFAIAGATSNIYFASVTGNYKVHVTNVNGCSKLSAPYAIIQTCRTGEVPQNNLSVSPNPCNGNFKIAGDNTFSADAEIRMMSPDGKEIFAVEKRITGSEIEMHLPDGIAAGIYFLILTENGNLTGTSKFVVE